MLLILGCKKLRVKRFFITLGLSIAGILVAGLLVCMAGAVQYNGLWRFNAYGFLLKCRFGFVQTYQVTDSTILHIDDYDGVILGNTLFFGLGKLNLAMQDTNVTLTDRGSQTIYTAQKVDNSFIDEKINTPGDPKIQFLLFYETLKENYAFADLYNISFPAIY